MSVNHYLLRVTDAELGLVLRTPERIRKLVERRSNDVVELGEDGVAIVSLTAESDEDPLAFIRTGAPRTVSGWIGKYSEKKGRVVELEVDMGYGPASYYRNSFLQVVAKKLRPIMIRAFTRNCQLDLLEDNHIHIYPGNWHDPGRKQRLVGAFKRYRACIQAAAKSGQHLLVWLA